jgi:3'(2'), 5'-bisphosphate nucleotidase
MMTLEYTAERRVAVDAVVQACRLCEAVRGALVSEETIAKRDQSPVTVADFGAQAVISHALGTAFPGDAIVAEEDASYLRAPHAQDLKARVIHYVHAVLPGMTDDRVLAALDRGAGQGGPTGRYWALDPIDGTKGFLRGEQYAVALALVEGGEVVLGVLGCPNLPVDGSRAGGPAGCLFIAVGGKGTTLRPLESAAEQRIRVNDIADPALASFCESFEDAHSAHDQAARVAALLAVSAPPLRMDSQCKYGLLARGDVSIYLRLPTRADYQEKVWDHAAGCIVVSEAGGWVSDIRGEPLDFSRGRTLLRNTGIVATNGRLHARVITAVRQALDAG